MLNFEQALMQRELTHVYVNHWPFKGFISRIKAIRTIHMCGYGEAIERAYYESVFGVHTRGKGNYNEGTLWSFENKEIGK